MEEKEGKKEEKKESALEQHQEDLRRLRELRPIDDDFMRCLFKDNIALAEFVLRIIMDKRDLSIIGCETQRDMKRLAGARSVCLDVYGIDSAGKKYDLEIQREDKGADPHRARYHSSVLDVENLHAGQEFRELPDTYTIFIIQKDFFGKGEPVYRIGRTNLATGDSFRDGGHILYVNGEYRGDSDLGKLMHDFNCSRADEMYFELMAERTRYFKENPKGVAAMCKMLEEMRMESLEAGKREGIEIGRKAGMKAGMKAGIKAGRKAGIEAGKKAGKKAGKRESAISTAKKMLADGMVAFEKIAEYTGLPLDEVKRLEAE